MRETGIQVNEVVVEEDPVCWSRESYAGSEYR